MSGEVITKSRGFGIPKHPLKPYVNEYVLEPLFDYLKYRELTEENVPNFAKGIFEDRLIPNKLKEIFINDFLLGYIFDSTFRNKYTGKYIVFSFIDNSLEFTIVDSKEEALNIEDIGKIRDFVFIGPLQKVNFGMINTKETKIVVETSKQNINIFSEKYKRQISIERTNHYNITCGLSSSPNYMGDNDVNMRYDLRVNCIYDPGADGTFLFLLQCWDFKEQCFNKHLGDPIIDEWYNHVDTVELIDSGIPCGLSTRVRVILLKKPLFISINGLDPVPIFKLYLPLLPPATVDSFLFLVGLDVINQHSSIISKFDGRVCLKIMNQREEF